MHHGSSGPQSFWNKPLTEYEGKQEYTTESMISKDVFALPETENTGIKKIDTVSAL